MCQPNQYLDTLAGLCQPCIHICDARYGMQHECKQLCPDFREEMKRLPIHIPSRSADSEDMSKVAPVTIAASFSVMLLVICSLIFVIVYRIRSRRSGNFSNNRMDRIEMSHLNGGNSDTMTRSNSSEYCLQNSEHYDGVPDTIIDIVQMDKDTNVTDQYIETKKTHDNISQSVSHFQMDVGHSESYSFWSDSVSTADTVESGIDCPSSFAPEGPGTAVIEDV